MEGRTVDWLEVVECGCGCHGSSGLEVEGWGEVVLVSGCWF